MGSGFREGVLMSMAIIPKADVDRRDTLRTQRGRISPAQHGTVPRAVNRAAVVPGQGWSSTPASSAMIGFTQVKACRTPRSVR
jgi:hypothetical protein